MTQNESGNRSKTLEECRELLHRQTELENEIKTLKESNRLLEERIHQEVETSRRQEQLIMRQAGLASMGQMVGAIAHQWRQPLTSIGFIIQNLKRAFELGKLDNTYLEQSVKDTMAQLQHMSGIIDNFRDFLKPADQKKIFDIPAAVSDTLSLFQDLFKNYHIQLISQVNPGEALFSSRDSVGEPLLAEGFPNEFKQVLSNIINNAISAIIRKREKDNMPTDEGEISVHIEPNPRLLKISIANNGLLIPVEILERMFEPFYSPLRISKINGVGLYMAKVIIENNMGGQIRACNTGTGATFTIELPRAHLPGVFP